MPLPARTKELPASVCATNRAEVAHQCAAVNQWSDQASMVKCKCAACGYGEANPMSPGDRRPRATVACPPRRDAILAFRWFWSAMDHPFHHRFFFARVCFLLALVFTARCAWVSHRPTSLSSDDVVAVSLPLAPHRPAYHHGSQHARFGDPTLLLVFSCARFHVVFWV